MSKLTSALLVYTMLVSVFSTLFAFPDTVAAAAVVEATNTSAETLATTSHSVALPAGIAAGDELLVLFSAKTVTFNLPTGWTELYNSGADDPGLFVIRRVADGGEGSTLTVTTGGAQKSDHVSYRFSGAAAAEISTAATGTSVNPDPPSLTPAGGALDYLWLAIEANAGDSASAYPTSYTNGFEVIGDAGIASARRELNAASENPGTFTIAASNVWKAVTVAVPPESTPADPPTGLTTTSNTGNVSLSWTTPASTGSSNLETYGVWRATAPFTATSSATLITSFATSTGTTYSDTSASHGTVYYYRVTATNATATSSLSNQKSSSSNSGRVIRLTGSLRVLGARLR
ncbi:hypothetical protein A2765_03830 [Candidatus Kaiserbacteria bacterium RIFCSPHIGHO2_01_FULL_56_24]|uniref:Fibronectin type-III domain-containing protein n=1 Tax=Candidatus Kaiserbacteria bacterium RIFCSPHIGHO2_01_FULL_56_24 TaxID=1798487 RepID=A0A1F6DH96_9BACT|nr:MAG: hypothetical protein A2765_03830 [Candidatus Kaiserbacteria bacterium RIFCSPHIGHO2_01_FULL_56_24]